MYMLLEWLRHPLRALVPLLGVLVLLVLGIVALGHSPGIAVRLGAVLATLSLLLAVRIPMRIVLPLIGVAIAIALIAGVMQVLFSSGGILAVTFLVLAGSTLRARGWVAANVFRVRPLARGARWATGRELRRAGFLGDVGWPIGMVGRRIVRLPALRERQGVLAVAPPGSGKTTGAAVPALLSETARHTRDLRSLVVGDPKDELAHLTLPTLARTHHPLVWDLGCSTMVTDAWRVGFDPLRTLPAPTNVEYVDAVRDLSDSWFWATRKGEYSSDPFFITQPLSLMRAMIFVYLDRFPQGSFVDLGRWIRVQSSDDFLTAVDASTSATVREFGPTLRALAGNERALAGIWADVAQRFELLDSPLIRAAMDPTRAEIDWDAFVRQPTVLYLIVSAQDSERNQPLLSLFFACMYRQLVAIAGQYGNTLPREVRVLIDEFGNLTRIYGIETALATLRSFGVGHYMFIQTSAQLHHHYGQDLARGIQDNLVTKLCLGGAADEDARRMSTRCGERTSYEPTTSYTASGLFSHSANRGHAPHTEPLVSAAEIMHMAGEVILSTPGLSPVRATLVPYYKDPELVRRMDKDKLDLTVALTQRQPATPLMSPPSAPTAGSAHQITTATAMQSSPTREAQPLASTLFPAFVPYEALPSIAGVSDGEWRNAPWTMREVMWLALGDKIAPLTVNMSVHQRWAAMWPVSTPAAWLYVTQAEKETAPTMAALLERQLQAWKMHEWLATSVPKTPGLPRPARVSQQEWTSAPWSLQYLSAQLLSTLMSIDRGQVTLAQTHEGWRADSPFNPAVRYWRITAEDAAAAPVLMVLIHEMAQALEINRYLGEETAATAAARPPFATPPPVPLDHASDVADGGSGSQRAKRDVPPRGCSLEEWEATPSSLRIARWSLEDDLLILVTGGVSDLDELHAQWQLMAPRCSPARLRTVTTEDAAAAPHVFEYVLGLARRLEIPGADDSSSHGAANTR